ncbi:hypothetical protein Q75_01110 [Bacillus coahuilensis p1.1.43]|uniref:DUF1572 domain-containing protein n=1 Tax=Bacillus coahuilensis p1.1.43 TaxID=1150625 RepID=A0A147KCD0_9BACI|nr:DUF1572 family protein [Bacillus coahuilensis]KUP09260.1 hypothetical protein Q75_01110 [Bacillus coahuilensis p1.1.43]
MSLGKEYLNIIHVRFKHVKSLGEKTLTQLTEQEIHWALNQESNSVSMIVKHMSGNMLSRWTDFLYSDGEKPDRDRDSEFIEDYPSKLELMLVWEKGWECLFTTLGSLTEEDLLKTITIRGEKHIALDAIERQLAHYACHVGQMVYIGKQLKDDQWKTLSIPRGASEQYLKEMLAKHD